ncbi:MAG: flap endonuclease, partial [Candidatus Poribacteria bacterium]
AEHRADANLFKVLATLRLDVPLRETVADLEWQGVPRATYEAFCEKLGLTRLAQRPHRWAD